MEVIQPVTTVQVDRKMETADLQKVTPRVKLSINLHGQQTAMQQKKVGEPVIQPEPGRLTSNPLQERKSTNNLKLKHHPGEFRLNRCPVNSSGQTYTALMYPAVSFHSVQEREINTVTRVSGQEHR